MIKLQRPDYSSPNSLFRVWMIFLIGLLVQTVSAEEFDINRFSDVGAGWFKTFYVEDTQSLQEVLAAGKVAADTKVLVTETAAGKLALITDQMAFHHIAEGSAGGKDWMATF